MNLKITLKIHPKNSLKTYPIKILFRYEFNIPNSKYNIRFKIISYQTSSTTTYISRHFDY